MSNFTEQLDQYGYNRRLAARATVQRASMADDSNGLVLFHGRSVIVLTADEAARLISEMQEVLVNA